MRVPLTIDDFFEECEHHRLIATKCQKCGELLIPPRPLCPQCNSTSFARAELKGKGTLLTYSIIHIAPRQFQNLAPYVVGIIRLDEGVQIPGIVRGLKPENARIGQKVKVSFSRWRSPKWPHWPRFVFKPTS